MMLLSYATNVFFLIFIWWGSWYATVDFYLFYDGAADMQIWALQTRNQCRVSSTQVPVKALRPLVCFTFQTHLWWLITKTIINTKFLWQHTGEEDVKLVWNVFRQKDRRTTDSRRSEKLTRTFSLGELKCRKTTFIFIQKRSVDR